LDNLGDENVSQAVKDNIRGQALFIRALQYYYLVDLFALPSGATPDDSQPGVPIQLEAVTSQDDFSQPSRSSVDEVYSQIISDLQTAQSLLPSLANESASNPRNRANKEAATALLARIALIRHDYQNAADYADSVLTTNNLKLMNDVAKDFLTETPPLS